MHRFNRRVGCLFNGTIQAIKQLRSRLTVGAGASPLQSIELPLARQQRATIERFPAGCSTQEVLTSIYERLDKTSLAYEEGGFCAVDAGAVVHSMKKWEEALPRVTPFYAIKCNANPTLLRILAALGTGFDCATKYEIAMALDAEVSLKNIIFAHPIKVPSHCRYAADKGVSLTTFDSEEELYKMKDNYPGVEAVVRIRAEDPDAAEPFGIKYGADVAEAIDLLKLGKELGISIVGVCFHSGYGLKNPEVLSDAVARCREVYDAAKQMNTHFKLIDIGGGYPGADEINDLIAPFSELASAIRSALDTHFPPQLDLNMKIIAEPGQYFARTAQHCATRIDGKRKTFLTKEIVEQHGVPGGLFLLRVDERRAELSKVKPTPSNSAETVPVYMYHLSHGAFSVFCEGLYDGELIQYDVKPLLPSNAPASEYYSTFWGPILTSYDNVRVSRQHKIRQLDVGDWVFSENVGAYSTTWRPVLSIPEHMPFVYYVTDDYWNQLKEAINRPRF